MKSYFLFITLSLSVLVNAESSVPANVAVDVTRLRLDPVAVAEAIPLAIQAFSVSAKAHRRELRHREELAKRGIAEVPACDPDDRYVIDTGGLGDIVFDGHGELYIDRRFVTDEEMKVVYAIEAFIARHFPSQIKRRHKGNPVITNTSLPVFRGFGDARYQMHDALIIKLTNEFNAHKAEWCGGTPEQAAKIADLSPLVVKAHMIEESGGNGPRSIAAWKKDPLQVNVPGDWGEEKCLVGLSKPEARNEGELEMNVRAAIKYLSRKGFSSSARPAGERPKGYFDGWLKALRRYNGRRDRTDTDRYYSEEYADKILRRANNPDLFVPIEIKLAR